MKDVQVIDVPDWVMPLGESVKAGDEITIRYRNLIIEITVSGEGKQEES